MSEPTDTPTLTDELAEVLAEVLAGTIGGSPSDSPAADLTAVELRRAELKRGRQAAALAVLQQLGYVHQTHDGGWFIEFAGREALAAQEAAREAARIKALSDAYAELTADLRAIADAIDELPTAGLAEPTVDLRIGTTLYARNPKDDATNVATVDAVATAVLGISGTTAQLGSSTTWQHKAEARRGRAKVEVASFIEDPTAREREQAELERVAEVERLRAELAAAHTELRAANAGRERAVQALADSL